MDKLYIGDIPLDNTACITFQDSTQKGIFYLYEDNANKPDNATIRIYQVLPLQDGKFIYNIAGMSNSFLTELQANNGKYYIDVSHKWYDRSDALTILAFFCCVAVATLWLVNLFTSVFKKGGLLGGLF